MKYKKIWDTLNILAHDDADRIELLDLVNPATPKKIKTLLEQKPHIFHFIGQGRSKDENQRDTREIALVEEIRDEPDWMNANQFSGLFNYPPPSIILLQACEGAALSSTEAFAGVASQLIQQNIPVVVAMQ